MADETGILRKHPLNNRQSDNQKGYLNNPKRLEWVFIAVRWLIVIAILVLAHYHTPLSVTIMVSLVIVLGIINIGASFLNTKIKSPDKQRTMGLSLLIIDTIAACVIVLLFVDEFYTAVYAIFVYLIIESAIRFGLAGSIYMLAFFAVGLLLAYAYRDTYYDVRFSASGYIFWVAIMSLVAISIGLTTHEAKKQRKEREKYLRQNVLLRERDRISREMHDNVLKTLHGLSFEAQALSDEAPSSLVKKRAKYLQDVCLRTSQEIREAIFNLRKDAPVDDIGIQLSKILEVWSKASGIKASISLPAEGVILQYEFYRNIQNIFTEALDNTSRHASASQVRVSLRIANEELLLEIKDNGTGFNHNMADASFLLTKGKLGIISMKERAESLGGNMLIRGDEQGTVLYIKVPINRPCAGMEGLGNE